MRIAFVLLLALFPPTLPAAPARLLATEAVGFVRGAPLPKWVEPLGEIPRTVRTDPVVVRASDVQALVGPVPAITHQRAIQVNDSSALGQIGQFGIGYYAQYQKLVLHKVVILRGEQRLDRTATVNIRPLQRETQIESGVLGGATTLQLLLDDVRIGDTLSISYTIEGANPVFGKIWSADFPWDSTAPAELIRLSVLHPRSRPVQWRQLGDFLSQPIVPQHDVVNGLDRIRFESRGVEEVSNEPSTPSDYFVTRVIQFSEYKDWQTVATWAEGLFPKRPVSPALSALVAELRKHNGQAAQASAALQWVQNQIRYFSVSIGENAQRPHAPDVVLRRRYGDCKDKSYLLISLLGELGIAARPVLLSAQSPRLPAKLLATSSWFDHAMVQITIDGREYYVDPTRTHQPGPLEMLPIAFPGAAVLVVDKSTKALVTLPQRADVGPRFEHVENIVVADFNGSATLETRNIYRGSYADAMRQHFTALSAGEQKNEALAAYEKTYPGVVLTGAPKYQDFSAENRVEIVSRYQLPKSVSLKDNRYSIDFESKIVAGTIGIPDKLVRKFPFELAGGRFQGRYRLRIVWPDSVRAPLTELDQTLDNPYFYVREDLSIRGNLTEHLIDYRIKQAEIPAAELVSLQEHSKKLHPFILGSLNLSAATVLGPQLKNFSYRNLDDIRHATDAIAALPALKASKDAALVPAEVCRFALNVLGRESIVGVEAAQFSSALVKRLGGMGDREGIGQCMGQLAFAAGDFDISRKAWMGEGGIADDSLLTRQLAWSLFYGKDSAAAIATMARYQAARSKAGSTSASDAANQIALLQRAGQPLPAELEQFARAIPDGPWPRPVLAMQVGLIDADELVRQAEVLTADAREIALTDAWFYIGQKRLAQKDEAGARRAFDWYRGAGVRSSGLPSQANAEWRRLQVPNPSVEAAQRAVRANDMAAALAAWEPGAKAGIPENQLAMAAAYAFGLGVNKDEQQALKWVQLAVAQGYPDAFALLGGMYEDGIAVPKDQHRALDWYRKAAELGHAESNYLVGNYYRYGGVVERDQAQALRWFAAGAKLGSSQAMASLGELYSRDEGVARDDAQAEFWTNRAIYHGNTRAVTNLGRAYAAGKGVEEDPARAVALYRLAADRGNLEAQVELGFAYEHGIGLKKSMDEANTWYRKAAEAGHSVGQYYLGESYWYGKRLAKDPHKAIAWYRKSADQGYAFAQVELGTLYEEHIEGGKQYAEAKRWYEKAAEQEYPTAESNLGKMYEFGKGVPVDQERMRFWYARAASHGYRDAQYRMGNIYRYGEGVTADQTVAVSWFDQAAQQDHVQAQSELGRAYLFGIGVARDQAKAIPLLRKAAEQGNATAQSNLGYALERGWGVAADTAQATQWYERAANQGNSAAQVRLAKLYERLKFASKAQAAFAVADQANAADGHRWTGYYYWEAGDLERAEQAYLRAVAMAEKAPGKRSENLISQLEDIVTLYMQIGKDRAALPFAQRAVAVAQTEFGPDSVELSDALEALGDIHARRMHASEAEAPHLRAMAIRDKAFGTESAKTAAGRFSMGYLYMELAQFAKAETYFEQAYAMRVKVLGEQHEKAAWSMHTLGQMYTTTARYKEAESWLQRAANVRERLGAGQILQLANTLNLLGTLHDRTGQHEQAELEYKRALDILERFGTPDDISLAAVLNNTGRLLLHRGRLSEAEPMMRRAMEIKLRTLNPEHMKLAPNYQYLGELFEKQQRHAEAESHLQHALRLVERDYGPQHLEVADSLQALGAFYHGRGRFDAAEPLLVRAQAIRDGLLGVNHPDSKLTRATLAAARSKTRGGQTATDLERTQLKR